MTAEIVVINKLAVALAADSAVTIGYEGRPKIYNSANKLFMLSQYQPVGIMFYGAAEFMGIPWETIIKFYRMNIHDKRFPTLREYAQDFLVFLEKGMHDLFPESQQIRYYQKIIKIYYDIILRDINDKIRSVIEMEGNINSRQVEDFANTVIETHYQEWQQAKTLSFATSDYVQDTFERYKSIFSNTKEQVFQELPISEESLNKLRELCIFLVIKEQFPSNCSGVIFAGFGDKEIFPSAIMFEVEAIINNHLKYIARQDAHIDFDNTQAAIIPFAQSEMVGTFMEGIDPSYREKLLEYLSELFELYPKSLLEGIPQVDGSNKKELLNKLKHIGKELLADFEQKLDIYQRSHHVNPILDIVANLPLDELAVMAESLVNITSFKRRVSLVLQPQIAR